MYFGTHSNYSKLNLAFKIVTVVMLLLPFKEERGKTNLKKAKGLGYCYVDIDIKSNIKNSNSILFDLHHKDAKFYS